MGDYLPAFRPGQAVTRKASANITGGQAVEVTGNGTVGPAAADSLKYVGVAGFDAKTGDDVVVHKGGVQRPRATGTVTAGSLIACGANGTFVTTATAGVSIGVASTSAAAGEPFDLDTTR